MIQYDNKGIMSVQNKTKYHMDPVFTLGPHQIWIGNVNSAYNVPLLQLNNINCVISTIDYMKPHIYRNTEIEHHVTRN